MIFASTGKNKEALEDYTKIWDETKDQIELTSGNKPINNLPDDNLPLCKILKIPVCIIVGRSVFQENNNYYPQVFLHECFYECEYEYENDCYSIL